MPKFIGQRIEGATRIDDNASAIYSERVKLSYSQARLLPPEQVMCSLDTTDRGGQKSFAKRWYRWFATPQAILQDAAEGLRVTRNMQARAEANLNKNKEE